MVDIHCHLLPGVDDGAKSWEMTLQMCEKSAADGVTHIVATPHCNHRYGYDRAAFELLLDELRWRFPRLEFSLGCDFHLSYENIEDARKHPERYTIGSTSYLLVEFSDFGMPGQMTGVLTELADRGLRPIITHPERNPMLQRRLHLLEHWISFGCLIQVTANSLTGFWGPEAKRAAEKMLKEKRVHIIASDAHDPIRRSPVLSEGRKAAAKIVGEDQANTLVLLNPGAIVKGEMIAGVTTEETSRSDSQKA